MMDTGMTIDRWISLVASIGACLSAIAAFLAVRQASNQRKASYRPEFVIAKTYFKCIPSNGKIFDTWVNENKKEETLNAWLKVNKKGETLDTCVNKNTKGEEKKRGHHSFAVHLQNVGLGAAKEVKIKWSFSIEALVAKLNEFALRSSEPIHFEYDNEVLSLDLGSSGGSMSMWKNQQENAIDFVLPAQVELTPIDLIIPDTYIRIISALLYFSAKTNDFSSLAKLPALTVDFDYFDIGGTKHKSKFLITPSIYMISVEKCVGLIESTDYT